MKPIPFAFVLGGPTHFALPPAFAPGEHERATLCGEDMGGRVVAFDEEREVCVACEAAVRADAFREEVIRAGLRRAIIAGTFVGALGALALGALLWLVTLAF